MKNFLENYVCEGAKLDIFTYPSPVLSKVGSPLPAVDDEVRTLCKDMLFTMYHAPGIGLAAPQIGKSIRLFVCDVDYDREEVTRADGSVGHDLSNFNPRVFINPIIEEKISETTYEEGCLSVPGVHEIVKRAEKVVVSYLDLFGNQQRITADGLLAICIQHEVDHLDGIVFIERLSPLKKNLLKKKLAKQKKKLSDL